MNPNTHDPAAFNARADQILTHFENEGGFADPGAIQAAHESMLSLVEQSERVDDAVTWANRRNALAFWCALCLSLQQSPRVLVSILSGLPRRQESWGAQLCVSLFHFQARLEAANRLNRGYTAIPIDALERVRQELFHVFWSLWDTGRGDVFSDAHLPITQPELTGRQGQGAILEPGSWVPSVLKELAGYGVAEAEYLLALIGPAEKFDIQDPDDQEFILTSYSLGHRWLRDHRETAKRYFERVRGFDLLSPDEEEHQHAYNYLNSFPEPCALLDAPAIGARLEPEDDCLLPYMDFLWSLVDESRHHAEDIEAILQKEASEKKRLSDLAISAIRLEAYLDQSSKARLSSMARISLLLKEPHLGDQILRTTRCAHRLDVANGPALHEELIATLHIECGRLIEAYFKHCLSRWTNIPNVPTNTKDMRKIMQRELRHIYKSQNKILVGRSPLGYSFGSGIGDDEIRKIREVFLGLCTGQFDLWEARHSYRVFLGVNLWIVISDRSHPWRKNETLRKMNLPTVRDWYTKRNEHAHFSPNMWTLQGQKVDALHTLSDILLWLETIT